MPNSQIKQGQTVHMLQIVTFCDIYSISPPIYIYIYMFYSYIFYNSFIEDAMPEKALKYALFKEI